MSSMEMRTLSAASRGSGMPSNIETRDSEAPLLSPTGGKENDNSNNSKKERSLSNCAIQYFNLTEHAVEKAFHASEHAVGKMFHAGENAVEHAVHHLSEELVNRGEEWAAIAAVAVRKRHRSAIKKRGAAFNLKRAKRNIAQQKLDILAKERKDKSVIKEFNFAIGEGENCKLVRYEDTSCFFLSRANTFRQFFVRLMNNRYFEGFILLMIMINAIFFSIADYSYVDSEGTMLSEGSLRNSLLLDTNLLFTIVFTMEATIKIIAQGFIGRNGSYLHDSWNILDFVVVISALLIIIDDTLPSIGSLRLIRILRPLRSLTMLPGLRDIVKSIFASIPELGGVFSLLAFIFLIFSIAGIELFGGPGNHARCRATPYPVTNAWTPDSGLDYSLYKCLDAPNFNLRGDNPEITMKSSPWAQPQECYWPLADTDSPRVCSLSGGGFNKCIHDIDVVPIESWSWCGSNIDGAGNKRFVDTSPLFSSKMYGNGLYSSNDKDTYIPDLNWGYTNFDSFGMAFITIFQCITEEGWSQILYMNQDSGGENMAGVYFTLLIFMGCFFVLQLLLAVLEDNFHTAKENVKLANEEQKRLAEEADKIDREKRAMIAAEITASLYNRTKFRALGGDKESTASLKITGLLRRNSSRLRAKSSGLPGLSGLNPPREMTPTSTPHSEASLTDSLRNVETSGGAENIISTARSAMNKLSILFQSPKPQNVVAVEPSKEQRENGGMADTLAMFVASREEENKTMTRLEHLQLHEFVGLDIANWFEDIYVDFKDMVIYAKNGIKSIGAKLRPETKAVDLNGELPPPTFYEDLCGVCVTVAQWKYFEAVSGTLILLNCVTLMADHYPMNPTTGDILDVSNAILTLAFFLEMDINLLAFGPGFYVKDALSGFDAFVVFASMVDLILAPPTIVGSTGVDIGSLGGVSSVISILRCFRLFRIVKLAIRIKSLKILFVRVAKTFADLATYMVLLMVLIFMYTVAGLQFFSNQFRFDSNGEHIPVIYSVEWLNAPDIPRYNFDDFTSSFASVFQIITTENWNDIMYNTWRVYGRGAVIFPISLVMIGTFILMNLFLGILLSNFDEKSSDDLFDEIEDELPPVIDTAPSLQGLKRSSILDIVGSSRSTAKVAPAPDVPIMAKLVDKASDSRIKRQESMKSKVIEERGDLRPTSTFLGMSPNNKVAPAPDEEMGSQSMKGRAALTKDDIRNLQDDQYEETDKVVATDGIFPLYPVRTLGIFSVDNSFRIFLGNTMQSHYFETFIQTLILLSSISLAIDNPLDDPSSNFRSAMFYFEWVTTILFTLETITKVVVTGFVFNQGAYLRSGWNCLDFVIVAISLIGLFDSGGSLKALKSIRSLRALRPLRVISRAPGLRTIVNAVFDSIPDVINVLVVVLVCFSIFAVIGVNFLKGDLRHCAGDQFDANIAPNMSAMNLMRYPQSWSTMNTEQKSFFASTSSIHAFDVTDCTSADGFCCSNIYIDDAIPTGRNICECWGGNWKPVSYSTLDDYPTALMSFFAISTTEGWVDLMYAAVDANGIDMQPIRDSNAGYVYFFVLFIVLGNFFALNLFVGVMIDNFEKTKFAMQEDLIFMTPAQQEWTKAQQQARSIRPHTHPVEPSGPIAKWCFQVCCTHEFEVATLFVILVNTVVLATGYLGMSDELTDIFYILNIVFSSLFTIEMVIKLIGLRGFYFNSVWNIFDFIVTIGSDIGILVSLTTGNPGSGFIMLLRIFRVLRVVRLMEGLGNAKRLVDTLILTLPGIINISLLLVLILFIYAVLGMQLFAKTQYNESYDVHNNFRTFRGSLLALVRFATGEGWGHFMYDASEHLSNCVVDPDYSPNMCGFSNAANCEPLNGCGNPAIFPFLLSFTLFVSMVLFNLFVGVIIEGFSEANDITKALKNEDYNRFSEHWAHFDNNATCFMSIEDFEEFVASLFSPLGLLDKHPTHNETIEFLSSVDLNVYRIKNVSNYVHFKECLVALISHAMKESKDCDLTFLDQNEFKDISKDATAELTKGVDFEKVTSYTSSGEVNNNNVFTLKEHYAALHTQHFWRKYQRHKKMTKIIDEALVRARQKKASSNTLVSSAKLSLEPAGDEVREDAEAKRDISVDVSFVSPSPTQTSLSKTNSIDNA